MTLSSLPYRVLAALDDAAAEEELETLLLTAYRPMLESDTDTLWETGDGQRAFQFAGSLCHGWSALPAWYLQATVLGVRPLAPGFKRFLVAPRPGSLPEASGEVVTPAGMIHVSFRRTADGAQLTVRHPASLVPEVDTTHLSGAVAVKVEPRQG